MVVGLAVVNAYPQGPPISACTDMFPVGHNANAQTSTPTVTIKMKTTGGVATTSYTAGEQIQGVLVICIANLFNLSIAPPPLPELFLPTSNLIAVQ